MTPSDRYALEIVRRGGAIMSSTWTTGTGSNIKKRPIPELCMEVHPRELHRLPARSKAAAEKLLEKHPKARNIIAIRDWSKIDDLMSVSK